MRTLIVTLFLVSLAILAGVAIKEDPGYVEIVIAGKSIQTSFAFLAFAFLAFYFSVYVLVKFALFLFHLPENFAGWRKRQKSYNARLSLNQGLIDLAEGRWEQAEKKLVRLAEYSDAKLLNYLAAARAAQHQNAHDRRDAYLKKAIENNPQADIAVGITQAELQIAHNQIEQALATLNRLSQLSPKHIYIKKLLAKIYIRVGEWEKFIDLLPELKKHHLFQAEKLDELERKARLEQIENKQLSAERLVFLWQALPKSVKQDKNILFHYAKRMKAVNNVAALEECINSQIKQLWDERLIKFYGEVKGEDALKQLQFAESLLKEHDKSPMLYLTLGRLSIRQELWGKAKTYLKQSIDLGATIDAYKALADLHLKLGEAQQAQQYYQAGLELAVRQQKNLPE